MSGGNQPAYVGLGFISLLAVAFIVLKLTHVIDWNWLWVLAPVWYIPAIVAVVVISMVMIAVTRSVIKCIKMRIR